MGAVADTRGANTGPFQVGRGNAGGVHGVPRSQCHICNHASGALLDLGGPFAPSGDFTFVCHNAYFDGSPTQVNSQSEPLLIGHASTSHYPSENLL
jgi:hypothetical protein